MSYFHDFDYYHTHRHIVFHSAAQGLMFRSVTGLHVPISPDLNMIFDEPEDSMAFIQDNEEYNLLLEAPPLEVDSCCGSDHYSGSYHPAPSTSAAEAECPTDYSGPVSLCTLMPDYMSDRHWGVCSDSAMEAQRPNSDDSLVDVSEPRNDPDTYSDDSDVIPPTPPGITHPSRFRFPSTPSSHFLLGVCDNYNMQAPSPNVD